MSEETNAVQTEQKPDSPSTPEESFGSGLAQLIKSKGVRPNAVAASMGVHSSTVYGWINGRTLPTVTMLFRLSDALNVPVIDLLGLVRESDWRRDGIALAQNK